jgi:hypothetical protein
MKLKNANIKSKEEALHRMIDGEVFYHKDVELSFTSDFIDTVNSYFVVINKTEQRIDPLKSYLDWYQHFQKEVPWEDDLQNGPILCHVWDTTPPKIQKQIRLVQELTDNVYYDQYNTPWDKATPVTKEDLWNKGE